MTICVLNSFMSFLRPEYTFLLYGTPHYFIFSQKDSADVRRLKTSRLLISDYNYRHDFIELVYKDVLWETVSENEEYFVL